MPRSATSTFEPPPSIVTSTPCGVRDLERRGRSRRSVCVSTSQFGRAADLEGGQRRQRRVPAHAIRAERLLERAGRCRSRHVLQVGVPQQLALARDQRRHGLLLRAGQELDEVPGRELAGDRQVGEITWPIFG